MTAIVRLPRWGEPNDNKTPNPLPGCPHGHVQLTMDNLEPDRAMRRALQSHQVRGPRCPHALRASAKEGEGDGGANANISSLSHTRVVSTSWLLSRAQTQSTQMHDTQDDDEATLVA